MKAFVNLLIKTDEFDHPEELLETVKELLENEHYEIVWSSSKEAED